jgi:hypothetical protein
MRAPQGEWRQASRREAKVKKRARFHGALETGGPVTVARRI